MLLEHERNYGLVMGALVTACSWNTIGSMAWAWMLWSPYALGPRTELWFGHGCPVHRILWSPYALGTRSLAWFGYGCSRDRMHDILTGTVPKPLQVHKPKICSLASKMTAWSTPQMTSKPSNPLKSPETHSFCYQPVSS